MKPWKNDKGINESIEYYDEDWKQSDKHRWDAVRAAAFAKVIDDGDLVLDLGAGCFGMAQWAVLNHRAKALYIALDFSPVAMNMTIEVMKEYKNFKYVIGNALNTEFADETFDVVFAGELIEHMNEPDDLVKEQARVCRYNGVLVASTVDPYCEDARINKCTYPEHKWEFEPDDLIKLYSKHGNVKYERVGNYHMIYCEKSV